MSNCPINNTKNFIKLYGNTYSSYSYLVNNLLCNGLVGFGVISNIVILLTFSVNRHLWLKSLVRYFIGLVVFDLFVLSGTWLLISWKIFNLPPMFGSHVYAIYTGFIVTSPAVTACIWCTVLITTERYLSLCHPLLHRRIRPHSASQIYGLVTIAVAAILYRIPKWFELHIAECTDENDQSIIPVLWPTRLLQNPQYMIGYRVVGSLVFHSVGPFLLLTVMSVLIVRKLTNAVGFRSQFRSQGSSVVDANEDDIIEHPSTRHNRSFQTFASMSAAERRMTIMQFVIVAQFLLCYCKNLKISTKTG